MTKFVVVLVEPKIQGNIGAVARAMMNFDVRRLRIAGGNEITEEARRRAVHAQGILDDVVFYPTFEDAVKDLSLKVATTGVAPDNQKRHLRSHLELEEFAGKVFKHEGRIGLIFGRENYGLYNSELQLCDVVVNIPTSDDYPIMNLSHAVSTVLYRLYVETRIREGIEKEIWIHEGFPHGVDKFRELGSENSDQGKWRQEEGGGDRARGGEGKGDKDKLRQEEEVGDIVRGGEKKGDIDKWEKEEEGRDIVRGGEGKGDDGKGMGGRRKEDINANVDLLFRRIDRLLERIEYPEHKSKNTSIMIRRILGRAFLSNWEYHSIMGVLSKIERALGINREYD